MHYYPNLELEIKKRNMTTHDLAIVIGTSDQAAYKRRHGKTQFSLGEAVRLLDFFECNDVKHLFMTEL